MTLPISYGIIHSKYFKLVLLNWIVEMQQICFTSGGLQFVQMQRKNSA